MIFEWIQGLPFPLDIIVGLFIIGFMASLVGVLIEFFFQTIIQAFAMSIVAVIYIIMQPFVLLKKLFLKVSNNKSQPKNAFFVKEKYKAKQFMTPNERKFFFSLHEAFGEKYHIMSQVRMADLIQPDAQGIENRYLFNRIRSKHFDYVLLTKERHRERKKQLNIVCIIELDDASHRQPGRIKSDELKNKACKQAGLCLIRYQSEHYGSYYEPDKIKSYIESSIRSFQSVS